MASAWWAPGVVVEQDLRQQVKHRLGFAVDVVSYGQRTSSEQDQVQHRLQGLLRAVVTDVGDDFDKVDRDCGHGDCIVVFLPTDGDPTVRLPALLSSVTNRLAADNAAYEDRIRLRMAVGAGLVARAAKVFAGPLVVNICRLVDSEPLRRAVADHPGADLVALVLGTAVAPGYVPLTADSVELVDVAMKEFVARAWVWASTAHG
jgi:hypothetical protein